MKNPCSKTWDSMTGYGEKRLCETCQVQVVDFSQKSTEEIVAYLTSSTNRVCGRIHRYQLAVIPRPFNLGRLVLPSFLALTLSFNAVQAQHAPLKASSPVTISKTGEAITVQYQVVQNQTKMTILGLVVDASDGIPVHGAKVMIKNTKGDTLTNTKGEFELIVSNDLFIENKPVLLISYIGYTTFEHTLVDLSDERLRFELTPVVTEVGELLIRRGLWYHIKSLFRRKNKPTRRKKRG